mmetsp:Transcript_12142/g.24842  ORF Transcript_12142/g.24842 Transcript_12142/m.24842 type:complete len:164 (-) Transcript_12142:33-524(-)
MAMKKTEEQEWELHTEKKIQEAFRLYDKDNKGTVSEDEVQYIMRYLNVYPTEMAMVNLIKQEMQDDEPTTYVTYDRLKTVMLRLLKTKEWEPDAEDILIQAFKTLDTDNLGYIEWDKIKDILTTKGEAPFRNAEIDAFQRVAVDMETGRVYYEDYIAAAVEGD